MKPKNIEGGTDRPAADSQTADRPEAGRMAADSQTADGPAAGSPAADRTAAGRTVTDRKAQRRKSAVQSAVLFTVIHLVAAGILLWARAGHDPASFLAKFTLVLTGLELVSVIPLWFSLKARLKEIEGGEEDAAAQY